jgi:hypothetical protein
VLVVLLMPMTAWADGFPLGEKADYGIVAGLAMLVGLLVRTLIDFVRGIKGDETAAALKAEMERRGRDRDETQGAMERSLREIEREQDRSEGRMKALEAEVARAIPVAAAMYELRSRVDVVETEIQHFRATLARIEEGVKGLYHRREE